MCEVKPKFKEVAQWDLDKIKELSKEYQEDAKNKENPNHEYFRGKAEAYAQMVNMLKRSFDWYYGE